MSHSTHFSSNISWFRRMTMSMLAGCLSISLVACRGSDSSVTASSSAASALSGPPVLSAFWGTRMPRVCATVSSPPNAAQAAALIQCHMDRESREAIYLMQNIQIQMSGSHQVGPMDGVEDNIDNRSKVYDLHGSHDYYSCAPINESVMHNTGKNCYVTHAASTAGECWMVHDGSYHCELNILAGPEGRANTISNQPGPTAY